jgi:uncharacterized protein (TIGR02145 family)
VHLDCSDYQIPELDVSNNPDLVYLNCHNNLLTDLVLTNNTKLELLWCQENQLSFLDLSNNSSLREINLHSIPSLHKVCVWTMPFPPTGVDVHIGDSPNIYFTTDCSGDDPLELCKDIDGNVYRTVKIGTQIWMAENLKVTHYRNGDVIPRIINNSIWANLSIGACCVYGKNEENLETYGLLYNWFAVNDNRIIAPEGWHIPSLGEWMTLASFLGGEVGGKMKTIGTSLWKSPNSGATNESGFSALPGGRRTWDPEYANMGLSASFWSSNHDNGKYADNLTLRYNETRLDHAWSFKESGLSVRCVKD